MTGLFERLDWLVCYVVSTLVVLLGVAFGRAFVVPSSHHGTPSEPLLDALVHWDGTYYRDIIRFGYHYNPGQQSTLHFFPGYPLVSAGVMALTGVSAELALVITANICFAAALFLLARYADLRCGVDNPGARGATLLAVSFVPAGMYFRMGYTESLFLLLCVLQLYLMERRASPLTIAPVVCLATVTRSVGLVLLAPFLLYLVRVAKGRRSLLSWACLCVPMSLAGLLAFMAYCQWTFGDGLAFARNRMELWAMRPVPPLEEKVVCLQVFEPVWGIFVPSSSTYWAHYTTAERAALSLYVANPLYFLAAIALLALGLRKGWLSAYEAVLAGGLLLLPYALTAYEVQMSGMARYVTVVAPLYLVLGRLIAKLPSPVPASLLGISSFLMAAYGALFARGHWL